MFRSLRHREYRLYFFGQLVSFCGSWMQHTAQGWLIYRLTGDPFQLGLVAFLGQAPVLILGTWAGALADRLPRRRIVAVTQTLMMLQAAILAWLTFTDRVTPGHVRALAAMMGCLTAFDFPARQLLVGGSVPEAERHNALALHSSSVNTSRVIGPALAGFVLHLWGEAPCFLINTISYLAMLSVLWILPDREPAGGSGSPMGLLEGLRAAFHPEALRLLFLALGALSLVGMPFTVLMPHFADAVLHSGPRGLGMLMAATGAGATFGALFIASRDSSLGLERLIGGSGAAFGVGLIIFSTMRSLLGACIVLIGVGVAMIIQLAGANTLLQELAPPRLAGRVMALFGMVFMGFGPFGSLVLGLAAARFGAPAAVAAGGAAMVCVGLATAWFLPASVGRARDSKV